MCIAKDVMKSALSSNNIFRPLVLAMVSHNGQCIVGSSIRVSPFLRPLCLYKRIVNFKPRLKKAIVLNQPALNTADKTNWSCLAYGTGKFGAVKAPCQNCTTMFNNLEGFIKEDETNTVLGACAEYCPVDQLLPEEALSEEDNQRIYDALARYRNQCTVLFEQFPEIDTKCKEVRETQDEIVKNTLCTTVYNEIRHIVHIFGLKPECNKYFGSSP